MSKFEEMIIIKANAGYYNFIRINYFETMNYFPHIGHHDYCSSL